VEAVKDRSPELERRLRGVRLFVTDVDGVLTDGTLHYGQGGEETKQFHARDGLGLQLLMRRGIEVSIVSGRRSAALDRRVAELGIRHFFSGQENKWKIIEQLARELGIEFAEIAFAGDDLPDLGVFRHVGVPITVSDADPRILREAHWVTRAAGGRGAVREIADAILESRGELHGAGDEWSGTVGIANAFHVVIPARYAASRLPGKPLRPLAGRPLISHVWDRGVESGASFVVVATEDERVRAAVEAFGGKVAMTSPAHASGTDRMCEVADREGWPDSAIAVNLQGDEPFLEGALIRRVALALHARRDVEIATLATPIFDPGELFDPNVVKVVVDERGHGVYFSRAPIPWIRGRFEPGRVPDALPEGTPFLRHIGLYAYRVGALRRICACPPGTWERAESLEQLRALAMGMAIHVEIEPGVASRGVDTSADLERAELEVRRERPA
jgi:3-deoxy-manno-octulosonate cytidylyltransferase (CMP-KDO synthetase)